MDQYQAVPRSHTVGATILKVGATHDRWHLDRRVDGFRSIKESFVNLSAPVRIARILFDRVPNAARRCGERCGT